MTLLLSVQSERLQRAPTMAEGCAKAKIGRAANFAESLEGERKYVFDW
jgi:hypothetical protein